MLSLITVFISAIGSKLGYQVVGHRQHLHHTLENPLLGLKAEAFPMCLAQTYPRVLQSLWVQSLLHCPSIWKTFLQLRVGPRFPMTTTNPRARNPRELRQKSSHHKDGDVCKDGGTGDTGGEGPLHSTSGLERQPTICCKNDLPPKMTLRMKQESLLGPGPGSTFCPHASPSLNHVIPFHYYLPHKRAGHIQQASALWTRNSNLQSAVS